MESDIKFAQSTHVLLLCWILLSWECVVVWACIFSQKILFSFVCFLPLFAIWKFLACFDFQVNVCLAIQIHFFSTFFKLWITCSKLIVETQYQFYLRKIYLSSFWILCRFFTNSSNYSFCVSNVLSLIWIMLSICAAT